MLGEIDTPARRIRRCGGVEHWSYRSGKVTAALRESLHAASRRLLAAPDPALPEADFSRLKAGLKPVPMPLGEVLYESGSQQPEVYYPTTAIVSLL